MEGVACDLALSNSDHIMRATAPLTIAPGSEGPDSAFTGAVAVTEALVEDQVFTFTTAGDINLETLDHFAVAFLKHPPGFDGLAEELLQTQCRLLIRITSNIDTAAACNAERQS